MHICTDTYRHPYAHNHARAHTYSPINKNINNNINDNYHHDNNYNNGRRLFRSDTSPTHISFMTNNMQIGGHLLLQSVIITAVLIIITSRFHIYFSHKLTLISRCRVTVHSRIHHHDGMLSILFFSPSLLNPLTFSPNTFG